MKKAFVMAVTASLASAAAIVTAACASDRPEALYKAIDSGNLTALQGALSNKPHLEPICKPNEICKPLALAAQKRDLKIIRALVEAGADVNGRNAYGDTAFVTVEFKAKGEADSAKVREIRRYLLEHGQDSNQSNDFGVTPLSLLAGGGDVELMEVALRHGADLNHQSAEKGYTALMVAAQFGKLDAIQWLLTRGADATLRSKRGLTALETARVSKQAEAERLLLASG